MITPLGDPASTPSVDMGVFSELVRQQPAALRTTHPMQSLAVLGAVIFWLRGRFRALDAEHEAARSGAGSPTPGLEASTRGDA